MIVKTGSGYQVKSESGKNMSKANLSKGMAAKRLEQVEWFKNHGNTHKANDHRKAMGLKGRS
jgi:hypothetical protein